MWVAGVPLVRSRCPETAPGHARDAEPALLVRGGALVTRFLWCVWRASGCQGSTAAAANKTVLFSWS